MNISVSSSSVSVQAADHQDTMHKVLLGLLVIPLILMGLSIFLTGPHRSVQFTADFYGYSAFLNENLLVLIATLSFVVASVLSLVSIRKPSLQKSLGVLLVLISLLPLGTLFSQGVWIEALGGFPAIGSGQGIIKYFALLAIGLYLLGSKSISKQQMIWLNFFPVALVYIWIGGMKFTLYEAKGIETLVASSPLMAWMYDVFDLQTASNLIGVYDLAITAALGLSLFYKRYILQALLLASTVFIVTQTFLLSWSNALSADTLLSGGGQFIIKDIWFIVNLMVIYRLSKA